MMQNRCAKWGNADEAISRPQQMDSAFVIDLAYAGCGAFIQFGIRFATILDSNNCSPTKNRLA
jgi:hypothetical protein